MLGNAILVRPVLTADTYSVSIDLPQVGFLTKNYHIASKKIPFDVPGREMVRLGDGRCETIWNDLCRCQIGKHSGVPERRNHRAHLAEDQKG